ncbi:MAG: hypothetical protein CL678_17650 [Bdellovibrionaceae bacterium]|nr:hypothetical protein [Pseudobdellovibrionaceae bacterium]|tara:strand:+ start:755 stop:1270 length:516 start_codon:yes stop_codon:yes gene_type:complete
MAKKRKDNLRYKELDKKYQDFLKTLDEPIFLEDAIPFSIKPYKNKNLLEKMYLEYRLSAAEIALELSCAKSTIINYLKKFEIPTREPSKPVSKSRGSRYGEKIRGRKYIAHKREQEVIQKMLKLREQGFSYRQIAEILNTMNVPTKRRRGKWQGRVVCEILKRVTEKLEDK